MDWRTRARRIVNREEDLTRWRLALLRVIDPVEWYIAKSDESRFRRPKSRRGQASVVFAPVESGTEIHQGRVGHGPVESERAAFAGEDVESGPFARPDRSASDTYEERLDAIRAEYRDTLDAEARAMLAGRETRITTASGTVHARLIRFRIGAVFEHETWRASGGRSHGSTRIDRERLAVPLLVDYLARDLAGLGPDFRLIDP